MAEKKETAIVTANRLRELLEYSADTGLFRWRTGGTGRNPDLVAGSAHNRGYLTIRVDYKAYLSHRLAWLYVYGEFPAQQLDHINGIRSDNRIINLRECTNAENCQNVRPHKDGTSQYLGVSRARHCKSRPWLAHICTNGKVQFIGYFSTEIEASTAYQQEKQKTHQFGASA